MASTRPITISVSEEHIQWLKDNPEKSPSRIFRKAMYELLAGKLDVSDEFYIDPLAELVKMRNTIAAQNTTYKELMAELKLLRAKVQEND